MCHDFDTYGTALKRVLARFSVGREKGVMAFVVPLGVSQEDMMEGPFWRESLGRSLGSHDVAEFVVVMVAGKKLPASTLYPGQRRDGASSSTIECSTRYWLDPLARAKCSFLLKTHGPSERELANKTEE